MISDGSSWSGLTRGDVEGLVALYAPDDVLTFSDSDLPRCQPHGIRTGCPPVPTHPDDEPPKDLRLHRSNLDIDSSWRLDLAVGAP
jgi:hypothetical protein